MGHQHLRHAPGPNSPAPFVERTRCPVARPQKPPYADRTTDYHEWREGRCVHCQTTDARVLVLGAFPVVVEGVS